MAETLGAKRQRMDEVLEILRQRYPTPPCALHHHNAFELLVATILSAQCTDARVNLVTAPLPVGGPITYRFGLQATPTRPLPAGWRGWVWAANDDYMHPTGKPVAEHPTHGTQWWMLWSPYISSPFSVKPDAIAGVDAAHAAGVK